MVLQYFLKKAFIFPHYTALLKDDGLLFVVLCVEGVKTGEEVGIVGAKFFLGFFQGLLIQLGIDVILNVDVLGVFAEEAGLVQYIPSADNGVLRGDLRLRCNAR